MNLVLKQSGPIMRFVLIGNKNIDKYIILPGALLWIIV